MRRVALLVAAGALIVGCTQHGSQQASSRPSSSAVPTSLATGRVPFALVAYCGAGSHICPRLLLRRVHEASLRHKGYLIATPTTVLVGGFGCGGDFPTPVGAAIVTSTALSWTIKRSGGASLDCLGSVLAFLRFEHPVFGMQTPVAVRANDRTRRPALVIHTHAWPEPGLAPWADGRGMIPFQRAQ